MARQRGGRAPSRPTVSSQRPAAPKQQTRPATSAAYPPATAQKPGPPAAAPPAQQGSGAGGLMGQMASTAA